MANHKSAIKRAKQSEKARIRNRVAKTRVKNLTKDVRTAVTENTKDVALEKLNDAKSIIGKAVSKGIVPKNTGSRKVSRLTKLFNTLS